MITIFIQQVSSEFSELTYVYDNDKLNCNIYPVTLTSIMKLKVFTLTIFVVKAGTRAAGSNYPK